MAIRYMFNLVSKLQLKSLYRQQLFTGAGSVLLSGFAVIAFKLQRMWGRGKEQGSSAPGTKGAEIACTEVCCISMEYPEYAPSGWV